MISGTFSGSVSLPSLVGTSYISNPTSSSTKTANIARYTTSFSVSSAAATPTHSHTGSSLNNRFLAPFVVFLHHLLRAYISIGDLPLRKYWWEKMMHSTYFWIFYFAAKNNLLFDILYPIYVHILLPGLFRDVYCEALHRNLGSFLRCQIV